MSGLVNEIVKSISDPASIFWNALGGLVVTVIAANGCIEGSLSVIEGIALLVVAERLLVLALKLRLDDPSRRT